jgi:hypothetical protein
MTEQESVASGMHVTWLVRDVAAFEAHAGPTSKDDKVLPYGLNYQEWLELYFDVLGVDKTGYDEWVKENPDEARHSVLGEFDEDINGYPMLSRIKGARYDVIYRAREVGLLRDECLKVRSNTKNSVALRGLEKLLRICREAEMSGLSIYLMSE